MHIGAITPHLECYGGIRRFLELGNVFINRGHRFTIFSNKEQNCNWFDYNGIVEPWTKIEADYILIGDSPSLGILPRVKGKVFIYVNAGGYFLDYYKSYYGKYPFIVNNRVFLKYFPKAYLIEGGVNIHRFFPRRRKVLFLDGRGARKGSDYIREQLGDLRTIDLIGLRNLTDKEIAEAYRQGDYFVAWENREGWCNTAAEALASGLPVITNGVNCEAFSDKIIKVKNLREFFEHPMNKFSWENVANQILGIFKEEKE